MQTNLRHQSLNSHKYEGKPCPHGGDLYEAYAENNRPGAYRIFFCYPPKQQGFLFVTDIMVHPD